jgi:hypothetical protein
MDERNPKQVYREERTDRTPAWRRKIIDKSVETGDKSGYYNVLNNSDSDSDSESDSDSDSDGGEDEIPLIQRGRGRVRTELTDDREGEREMIRAESMLSSSPPPSAMRMLNDAVPARTEVQQHAGTGDCYRPSPTRLPTGRRSTAVPPTVPDVVRENNTRAVETTVASTGTSQRGRVRGGVTRLGEFKARATTSTVNYKELIGDPPKSRNKMLKGEHRDLFIEAEKKEIAGMEESGTYEWVPECSIGQYTVQGVRPQVLPCLWRYEVKTDRPKARIVVDGSKQRASDFESLFAPVCRALTFRLLCIYALQKGFRIRQADVKQAFISAPVSDEKVILTRAPPGYEREGMLIRLRKYAYGLRESPLEYYKFFSKWMVEEAGFKKSKIDDCLFYNGKVYVCIHVDDILYCGNSADMDVFFAQLESKFGMHDLGEASTYTGVQVEQTDSTVTLHQHDYIVKILSKYADGMGKISTPMDLACKLKVMKGQCPDKNLHAMYRSKVGALMYLATTTMPNIAYVVKELSRHLQHPGVEHMQACDRVFKYLRYVLESGEYRLTYRKNGESLIGACDASWADIVENGKSTTGVVFMYRGAAIVWWSQTQKCVTHSSTESELVALDSAVREFEYIRKIMGEFNMKAPAPTTILEDNVSCIRLADPVRNVVHQRTKHVNVRYFYVRDLVREGRVRIAHQHTDHQPADLLTKQLGNMKHARFTAYVLGITPLKRVAVDWQG